MLFFDSWSDYRSMPLVNLKEVVLPVIELYVVSVRVGEKCEVLHNPGRLIFNSPCLLRVPGGKAVSALCDLGLLLPSERGENKTMEFICYCRLP